MREYIDRLIGCGMSSHDAARLVESMVKDFGYDELEELVTSIERDSHVA